MKTTQKEGQKEQITNNRFCMTYYWGKTQGKKLEKEGFQSRDCASLVIRALVW